MELTEEKKRRPPMKCWVFERPYHFYIKPYARECPFEYVYREMARRAHKVSPREVVLHLNDYEVMFKLDPPYGPDVLFKIQNKKTRNATKYRRVHKHQLYKIIRRMCAWFYNKAWR